MQSTIKQTNKYAMKSTNKQTTKQTWYEKYKKINIKCKTSCDPLAKVIFVQVISFLEKKIILVLDSITK